MDGEKGLSTTCASVLRVVKEQPGNRPKSKPSRQDLAWLSLKMVSHNIPREAWWLLRVAEGVFLERCPLLHSSQKAYYITGARSSICCQRPVIGTKWGSQEGKWWAHSYAHRLPGCWSPHSPGVQKPPSCVQHRSPGPNFQSYSHPSTNTSSNFFLHAVCFLYIHLLKYTLHTIFPSDIKIFRDTSLFSQHLPIFNTTSYSLHHMPPKNCPLWSKYFQFMLSSLVIWSK